MLQEITAFLEKLPAFITRTGVLLVVAGGVFDATLRYELLSVDAAFGWISAFARPAWILGLSLIVVAIFWQLGRVLYDLRGLPFQIASRRAKRAALLSNVTLLDANSAIVLWALLERDTPRFDPNGETTSLEKLHRLGLIEQDDPNSWRLSAFSDVMKVARPIWNKRASIVEGFGKTMKLGGRTVQESAETVLRNESRRI